MAESSLVNLVDPVLIEDDKEDKNSPSPDEPSLPPILYNNNAAWEAFPWSKFPGWVKATRPGSLQSWIWRYGFDIESTKAPQK